MGETFSQASVCCQDVTVILFEVMIFHLIIGLEPLQMRSCIDNSMVGLVAVPGPMIRAE